MFSASLEALKYFITKRGKKQVKFSKYFAGIEKNLLKTFDASPLPRGGPWGRVAGGFTSCYNEESFPGFFGVGPKGDKLWG